MKMEYIARYTKKDFRIDTMAAGGPGGQHQNKTQSAVRITHIPTGLSASSRGQRSQHQNKRIACQRLARLVKLYHVEQERVAGHISNETLRTYHEADNRGKDHCSGLMQSWKESVGRDNIDEMIHA